MKNNRTYILGGGVLPERRTGTNLSSHNFRKGVGGVKGGDSRG